jgi:hypothetical protein
MSNNIKAEDICFEKIADEINLDPSSVKKFFKKKYCICNKLVLFFVLYCSLYIGLLISFVIILIILIIPFSSIFVGTILKQEEIFFNNSTYYDVFKKLNNEIDYQSEINNLRYFHIPNFIGLTILLIMLLTPYFFNKLKSIYFLLIFLIINTCILIINIFISILYSRVGDTFKKYTNELDNMFATNGTHIIPLDKRDKVGLTGSSSIFLCVIYYFLIIYLYMLKRCYVKENASSEDNNNKEYNENLNSTN